MFKLASNNNKRFLTYNKTCTLSNASEIALLCHRPGTTHHGDAQRGGLSLPSIVGACNDTASVDNTAVYYTTGTMRIAGNIRIGV